MKKLFLFLSVAVLTFSLNSCSSDDSSGGGEKITFKINGTSKTFTNIDVYEANGEKYITGYIGSANDPSEVIFIEADANNTGSAIISVEYYDNGDDYDGGLNANITVNTDTKFKATFSGTMIAFDGGSEVPLTNGSIDVSFILE